MPTETTKLTPEESALILRLADLMEQGAVGKRQITGQYFEIDGNGVCAMGAILSAVGVKPQPSGNINIKRALGIKELPKVMYPSDIPCWNWIWDATRPVAIDEAIISLNDYAGWDLAHIVMWLRQIASAS